MNDSIADLSFPSINRSYGVGQSYGSWLIEEISFKNVAPPPNGRFADLVVRLKKTKGFKHLGSKKNIRIFLTLNTDNTYIINGCGSAQLKGQTNETNCIGDECTVDVYQSCEGLSCVTPGNFCKGNNCIAYSYNATCEGVGCCAGPGCCKSGQCGFTYQQCPVGTYNSGIDPLTSASNCKPNANYQQPYGKCTGLSCVVNEPKCDGNNCTAHSVGAQCTGIGCCSGPSCCNSGQCSLR